MAAVGRRFYGGKLKTNVGNDYLKGKLAPSMNRIRKVGSDCRFTIAEDWGDEAFWISAFPDFRIDQADTDGIFHHFDGVTQFELSGRRQVSCRG